MGHLRTSLRALRPLRLAYPARLGLQARLVLLVVVLAVGATAAVVGGALYLVRDYLRNTIAQEQYLRTVSIAEIIDQRFTGRQRQLAVFANGVRQAGLRDSASLQRHLLAHPALGDVFSGVGIVAEDGLLVANLVTPDPIGRINLADRPYFQQTVKTGRSVISEPLRNRSNGQPQVVVTQPVTDETGRVVLVVNGLINLHDRGFLGDLEDIRFGKSGYMFITNTAGIVISSPRKSRILNHVDAEGGHNPATTAAVGGFEGTLEGKNRLGADVLYAFKQTRSTNWVVGSHYPRDEALAPLRTLQAATWAVALVLGSLAAAVSVLALRRQLAPLRRLRSHMLTAHGAGAVAAPLGETQAGEVGDLARSFDALMERVQANDARLRASRQYLQDVLSHAGDAFIAIDRDGRVTEWNRQAELVFGWPRDAVMGRSLETLIIPEALRAAHTAGMNSFLHTGQGPVVGKRIEIEALHRDGHTIPVELSVAAVDMGDHFVANAFVRDISERRAADARLAASRKFLQDVADNVPSLVAHVDAAMRYTFVNARIQHAHPGQNLIGQPMSVVRGDREFAIVEPWVRRALAGESVTFEKAGSPTGRNSGRIFEVSYIPDRHADGTVAGFYSMSFDITEHKLAEQAVAASEQRLRTVTDNLPALVSYLDREERFTFANAAFRNWFGLEPAEMIGRPLREVVGEEVYLQRAAMLQRALAGERVEFDSHRMVDGQPRDVHTVYVPDLDSAGVARGVFALSINITELKTVERKLASLARVDTLTDLPNRLAFNEALPQMLARARRAHSGLALMFLDIDRFKAINDTLGHAAGDDVLVEFAGRLRGSVRTTDLVVRLAGDEFVVVLEHLNGRDVAASVAEKIVSQVNRPAFAVADTALSVTTSIGIVYHAHGDPRTTPAEMLARADAALYSAKAAGRDTFHFAV